MSELYAGFENGSVVVYNLRAGSESVVGAKGKIVNKSNSRHVVATLKDHAVGGVCLCIYLSVCLSVCVSAW